MKNKFEYIIVLSLILCNVSLIFAQSTSATFNVIIPNRPNIAGNDYVGWDNTVNVPLEIRHNANQSIIFYTTGIQRATILGNGRVGIGINNPLWQLDVADEINISQPRNYYMIGGETVLHNAGTENIFTGVNCGKDILAGSASGNMNVFNGYSAGEFASGNDNVFIGHSTG